MQKQPTAEFAEFIEFFPELELPLSLLPDINQIPVDPLPLPEVLQEAYILPFEAHELDEYTEYVPFGRLAGTKDFHAMVYWKAGLLRYEYILATYSNEGTPLSHAIVGGIRYEEEGALHSVAVVNEDLQIIIAEGLVDTALLGMDPAQTQTYQMAILPTGIISYQTNEEEKNK